jgi:hypothetical protein
MPCSHCGSYFHNIALCDKSDIKDIYDDIGYLYNNLYCIHSEQSRVETRFQQEVKYKYTLSQLKPIAVQYLELSSRTNKTNIVSKLYYHFKDMRNQEDLRRAQTILRSISNDDMVFWRIDRTPDVITSLFLESNKQKIKTNIDLCEPFNGINECPICYEEIDKNNVVKLTCKHTYCVACIKKYLDTKPNEPCCSLCRTIFKEVNVSNIDAFNIINYV